MKNKNNALNAVIQSATLLTVVIFSIWASMGFKIDFTGINKAFVIKVSINLVVALFCYNTVYSMFFGNLARNEHCRYFIAVATKKMRVGKIYESKKFDELEKAVTEKNEEDLLELRNYRIRHICQRLSYSDIKDITQDNLEDKLAEFKRFYTLSKYGTKRLRRVIVRIISGKIKIDELTSNDILTERESVKLSLNRLKFYAKRRAVKRNLIKSFKFLVTAVVLAVITFKPADSSIWEVVVNNLSLFLSAAFSGSMAAASESKYITDLYEEHNKFILQKLDIKDEYTPDKI